MTELQTVLTVLQKIHLKTDFINTAIPSTTREGKVHRIIKAYLGNERKGIEKLIIDWSVIDKNDTRTGRKGGTYAELRSTIF